MPTVTVTVDEELKEKMDRHPEINWSAVARQTFEKKVNDLELLDRIASESTLTEEDVDEIADEIDRAIAERLNEE